MFRLFSKLMNVIVSMLDKVNCSFSCCSNSITVSVPLVYTDLSRKSMTSEMSSNLSSPTHIEIVEVSPNKVNHV